jgi:Lrp/AsnC family leucine-responsive transcriptional regulator
VRRLEDRGVIAGYRAIVAPQALGRSLSALVNASVERANQDAFLDLVRTDPAVAECHRTTGDFSHLVKVNVADTAALEDLVDRLSATGARCTTALVLSSPVPWREITPPAGTIQQRTRLTRRRRKAAAAPAEEPVEEAPAKTRRPGRPRGRRSGS